MNDNKSSTRTVDHRLHQEGGDFIHFRFSHLATCAVLRLFTLLKQVTCAIECSFFAVPMTDLSLSRTSGEYFKLVTRCVCQSGPNLV